MYAWHGEVKLFNGRWWKAVPIARLEASNAQVAARHAVYEAIRQVKQLDPKARVRVEGFQVQLTRYKNGDGEKGGDVS